MAREKSDDIEVLVFASGDSFQELNSRPATSVEDWDAPRNKENPRNWSGRMFRFLFFYLLQDANEREVKKACHVIPVSLLCLSVTAGSSMVTPGVFAIAHKFHVSHTAALLPLSLFVLGLAIGPVLAAPISETQGRAIVYKVSMPLYMLFILGAGLSNSFGGLLACRTLAAIAGAPCLAVGAGTVADLFEPRKLAGPGSLVVMAPFLGPCMCLPKM